MLLDTLPPLAPPERPERSGEAAILEAVYVCKRFRRRGHDGPTQALDDVRLVLIRGETLGIVGASGSGKSTLARILCGLVRPDSGEVLLDGQPISLLSRRALRPLRKRIQMVFQDPCGSLDPCQTVQSIVAEGLLIHGCSRRLAMTRAAQLLRLVGLDAGTLLHYPHEFSSGQQQRIGLARALALDPEILVADEPVSAIDMGERPQMLRLIETIKVTLGMSLVLVTQDLRMAMQMCDRIAVMQDGEVVEMGTAKQLYAAPSHPYTRALFAAVSGAEERVALTT
jgi:peptide/nickel transport system ATP-binding protein